jgi:hypothetical protein
MFLSDHFVEQLSGEAVTDQTAAAAANQVMEELRRLPVPWTGRGRRARAEPEP